MCIILLIISITLTIDFIVIIDIKEKAQRNYITCLKSHSGDLTIRSLLSPKSLYFPLYSVGCLIKIMHHI